LVDSRHPAVAGDGDFASGFPNGAFTLYNILYSPALEGYDGVSNLGPVSVIGLDNLLGDPWQWENDTGLPNDYIDFYSVSSATFSAGVPEPATWAMTLLGIGMIGGGLRMARRKNAMALTSA
jgi:hypothetical protein